jgi:hypothetical protein
MGWLGGGTVGGSSACGADGAARGTDGSGPGVPGRAPGPGIVGGMAPGGGTGVANGPGGGMPGPGPKAPIAGTGGDAIGPDGASGTFGELAASALPQLRQNFMPGGLSPRHTWHVFEGNPCGRAGVCPNAGASELPQLRQNDDPGGLSWPHFEQRIGPLTLNPLRACSNKRGAGMAPGRFATRAPAR